MLHVFVKLVFPYYNDLRSRVSYSQLFSYYNLFSFRVLIVMERSDSHTYHISGFRPTDGAHPKDVVEAAAEVVEASTEVEGAGEVGPE
jgi:hypothetical protein